MKSLDCGLYFDKFVLFSLLPIELSFFGLFLLFTEEMDRFIEALVLSFIFASSPAEDLAEEQSELEL